jgi:hypothetical protein
MTTKYKSVVLDGKSYIKRQNYVTNSEFVYRLYDPVEDMFCCAGHGDNRNGQSVWLKESGAKQTMLHFEPELRSRVILKKYKLTEVT